MIAFAAIDNIWKGASGQGVQNLNLMLGLDETEGTRDDATRTSSASRWVEPPAGVEQLDPAAARPRLPRRSGPLRPQGRRQDRRRPARLRRRAGRLLDPPHPQRLGRRAGAGLPRQRSTAGAVRAAVVNAGNANAETGEQGFADAWAMCDEAAAALGLDPGAGRRRRDRHDRRAAADRRRARRDRRGRRGPLGRPAATSFSEAIMTTDRWPKRCTLQAGGVTLSAQAKGAGMIEPGFATMLCFVQTDAVVDDPDAALRAAVDASFERITVDGQMSTNDTVLLQATGAAGAPLPEGLLEAVLLQLAIEIVRDGEGAARVARVGSSGAASDERGRAGRAGDRQLAAGQDRALRPRPQLGPDRAGRRHGAGRRGPRRDRRRLDRRRRARRRRSPRPRSACASTAARAPPTSGSRDLATSTCGSTPSTRPEES